MSEQRVGKRAEQKRRWDDENRAVCVDCGGLCGAHRKPVRGQQRCDSCARKKRRWKRDEAARLYNEGLAIREIAERLNTTTGSAGVILTHARREGLIGYRYNVKDGRRVGREGEG